MDLSIWVFSLKGSSQCDGAAVNETVIQLEAMICPFTICSGASKIEPREYVNNAQEGRRLDSNLQPQKCEADMLTTCLLSVPPSNYTLCFIYLMTNVMVQV